MRQMKMVGVIVTMAMVTMTITVCQGWKILPMSTIVFESIKQYRVKLRKTG